MKRIDALFFNRTATGAFRCVLGGLVLAACISPLFAHEQSSSFSTIEITEQRIEAEFSFRPSTLVESFELDLDGDEKIDAEELAAGTESIFDYLENQTLLQADFSEIDLRRQGSRLGADDRGQPLAIFRFDADLDKLPHEVTLEVDFAEKLGEDYLNLVKLSVEGSGVQQAVLVDEDPRRRFPVTGEPSLSLRTWQFIKLGAEHIFIGYDHILFLLALIVVGGTLLNIIKIVTSFTIAHSITLIMAALEWVSLPPRLVEAGIALSIVYVAAENLWIQKDMSGDAGERTRKRWMLTFFFGLVHGFGFANVLRDLGLPTSGLVVSLLSFNIGVEIGQILIVALLFPVTWWLARQAFQQNVLRATSVVIFLFGIGWLLERVFNLAIMPF